MSDPAWECLGITQEKLGCWREGRLDTFHSPLDGWADGWIDCSWVLEVVKIIFYY